MLSQYRRLAFQVSYLLQTLVLLLITNLLKLSLNNLKVKVWWDERWNDDNSDQDVVNDSMDNMVVQDECLDEKILHLKLQ